MRIHTVDDIAERYSVGVKTVNSWINNGELQAVNVAVHLAGAPRWRITNEALVAFETKRTHTTQGDPSGPEGQCGD